MLSHVRAINASTTHIFASRQLLKKNRAFVQDALQDNALQNIESKSYWASLDHQRKFFDQLEIEFGLVDKNGWGKITVNEVQKKGGHGLMRLYKGSLFEALRRIYPEFEWDVKHFPRVSQKNWEFKERLKNLTVQKQTLEEIGDKLGIVALDDWKGISIKRIEAENGGKELLQLYDNNLLQLLQILYPKYNWKTTESFSEVMPRGYWDSIQNQRNFMEQIASKFNIETKSEWGRITSWQLLELGGAGLLKRYDYSIYRALRNIFPEFDWKNGKAEDWDSQYRHISKQHQRLRDMLKPYIEDLQTNYKHPDLMHATSDRNMELDLYSESLKLALEYQGSQHYQSTRVFNNLSEQQARDSEKKAACQNAGITLVEIPHWWDGSTEQLFATIYESRPDLDVFKTAPTNLPIPPVRPESEAASKGRGFLLPRFWKREIDPTNWWLSEKVDGLRAYWNGSSFHIRNFKNVAPTETFKSLIPTAPLDGILSFTDGALRDASELTDWSKIRFYGLDIPNYEKPFEGRMEDLRSNFLSKENEHFKLIEHIKCKDLWHLKESMMSAFDRGTTVMMRKPGSLYEVGRSETLLKVEPTLTDESIVVNVHTKENKVYLEAESSLGYRFSLLPMKQTDERPFQKGQLIEYGFFGVSRDRLPEWPVFERNVRKRSSFYLTDCERPIQCRQCNRALTKGELIMKVKGIYKNRRSTESHWVSFSFCLQEHLSCFKQVLKSVDQNRLKHRFAKTAG
eukprot:TRINITY_DN7645_c0_g1_i1.p1 TRINITY_DN7645_c0_g1~~TRINITY_DN7645_c0_g1_i1.p1  ORF type:complete len:739 (-),score=144.18 TRINITY_DN7645_c0_g1_i1:253-2469(-)